MTFAGSSPPQKWPSAIGYCLVLPAWIWMAVRTKDCLRFVTGHRIPFPVRTIWLMKWFALILGAGGVAAAATDLGMPWYLALLPSAIVLLVALKEEIREIIPAKPDQGMAAYRSSWKQYWKLRSAYKRSLLWASGAFLFTISVLALGRMLPQTIGQVTLGLCFAAV